MLGEPDQWSRGASQSRGALLFCTGRFSGVNKRLLLVALALARSCAPLGRRPARRPAASPRRALRSLQAWRRLAGSQRRRRRSISSMRASCSPEQPLVGRARGGSDVAARLGFETSAMNLPRRDRRRAAPMTRRRRDSDDFRRREVARRIRRDASTRSAAPASRRATASVVAFAPAAGPPSRCSAETSRSRVRRGHARRPPAVRLGSEGPDHRQDRGRREAVPRRQGCDVRRPRPQCALFTPRRARNGRRHRDVDAADGERRRLGQGDRSR